MFHNWLQIGLTLLIGFLISVPTGRYLAKVVTGGRTVVDRVFDPFDNFLYAVIGRRVCTQAMDWKSYTLHMLATNMVMAILIFLILVLQDFLPLNQRHLTGMDPVLAFNTAISFITNTDWQAYGGETTLSNFSQMTAITFPMFTSATTGFVVAMAFIRAFTIRDGRRESRQFLSRLYPVHDPRAAAGIICASVGDDSAGRAADACPRRRGAHHFGRRPNHCAGSGRVA